MQPIKKVSPVKFIPGIIWLIVILILIWLPGNDFPHPDFLLIINFDKFVHAGMFGLLTILFCWPFYKTSVASAKKISYFTAIALLSSAFGYSTELIQKYWATGRSYDLMDWIADTFGVVVAYFLCRYVFARKAPIKEKVTA